MADGILTLDVIAFQMSWLEPRMIFLEGDTNTRNITIIGFCDELKEKLWKPELGIEEIRKSRLTFNLDEPKTCRST